MLTNHRARFARSSARAVTISSSEISKLGTEGRISPYHEMLLLNWRPAGEGGKLVSKLVLVRSPSYQVLAQVLVP